MQKLIEHIDRLCAAHEIFIENHSRGGRAYARKRLIKIRPIKSLVTYFMALHEIAHVVYPAAKNGNRLIKEAHAWEWALKKAEIQPNDAVRKMIHRSLDSYKRWAELRQYRAKPPIIPPKDHLFWTILDECS